jgi:hypothetical protein
MSKASNQSLDDLHGALAKALAEKIKSGDATAADMAVARQFLKDNGIESVPMQSNPLGQLASKLPFLNPETIEQEDHYGNQ